MASVPTSSSGCCCAGCAPCCTYPDGKRTLVPAILSILLSILSTTVWSTCSFARVQIKSQVHDSNPDTTDDLWRLDDNTVDDIASYSIGLYTREMLNFEDLLEFLIGSSTATASGCVGYSREESELQDASFKTARALGMMCGVLAFIIMLTFWCIVPCVRVPKRGWQVMGVILFVLGIFQISTLLGVLLSNVCKACGGFRQGCVSICGISTGGILAIVTSLLWMASGVVCCFITASEDTEDSLPVHSPTANSVVRTSRPKEENEPKSAHRHHQEKQKHGDAQLRHKRRKHHSPRRNHSNSRSRECPQPREHRKRKSKSHEENN